MAYLKPPAFVRKVFNPLALRFGLSGTQGLLVRRRSSSGTMRVPVIPVDLDGVKYVVSTRGESDWVKNLRAAGECQLVAKRSAARYSASEVGLEARPPVIDAYRAAAGKTVDTYWKQLPDASDHPTFALTPQ